MAPVLRHALATVEEQEGAAYDYLVLHDPTSPAREPADVDAAVRLLAGRPDWDGVVSVSQPTFHPVWVGVRGAEDDPDRMATSWMDEGVHGMVVIPESRAFAIDYRYEFDLLEALLDQGVLTLPWLRPGGAPRPQ